MQNHIGRKKSVPLIASSSFSSSRYQIVFPVVHSERIGHHHHHHFILIRTYNAHLLVNKKFVGANNPLFSGGWRRERQPSSRYLSPASIHLVQTMRNPSSFSLLGWYIARAPHNSATHPNLLPTSGIERRGTSPIRILGHDFLPLWRDEIWINHKEWVSEREEGKPRREKKSDRLLSPLSRGVCYSWNLYGFNIEFGHFDFVDFEMTRSRRRKTTTTFFQEMSDHIS